MPSSPVFYWWGLPLEFLHFSFPDFPQFEFPFLILFPLSGLELFDSFPFTVCVFSYFFKGFTRKPRCKETADGWENCEVKYKRNDISTINWVLLSCTSYLCPRFSKIRKIIPCILGYCDNCTFIFIPKTSVFIMAVLWYKRKMSFIDSCVWTLIPPWWHCLGRLWNCLAPSQIQRIPLNHQIASLPSQLRSS